MIGHYKLGQDMLKQLNFSVKNIEENIYDLCYPLLVNKKNDVPDDICYLYETLEIPIIEYPDILDIDINNYKMPEYIKEFSKFLKINIPIEMNEEGKIGHCLRVAKYSKELASKLDLSKDKIKDIYIAALFHDVGKSRIPKEIISKKSRLTDEEFAIIQTHSTLARQVLGDFLKENILDMIELHHERMDGSGYKGILPSFDVQILAIADSFDAMTSSRVYTGAKTKKSALNELLLCTKSKEEGGRGILYNPELVQVFIKIQNNK